MNTSVMSNVISETSVMHTPSASKDAFQLELGSASMTKPLFSTWIRASLITLQENARLLTALDQAIGDGDHGDNMLRGFNKLVARADELELLSLDAAFQMAGTTLVMSIGGASGPLFGSFFLGMGKALSQVVGVKGVYNDTHVFAAAFDVGVQSVKARGKADKGEKTMLDVLIPVSGFLHQERCSNWASLDFTNRLEAVANASMKRTKMLQATKGRASFLKERSRGHIDPGAMTTYLLVKTLCETVEL